MPAGPRGFVLGKEMHCGGERLTSAFFYFFGFGGEGEKGGNAAPEGAGNSAGARAAAGLAASTMRRRHGRAPDSPAMPFAGLGLYLLAFSPGLGPVPWAVNAELYPADLRGTGVGLAALANWAANFAVAQSFLPSMRALGGAGTWMLYSGVAAAGGAWAAAFLPETKGKSLDQIQAMFAE